MAISLLHAMKKAAVAFVFCAYFPFKNTYSGVREDSSKVVFAQPHSDLTHVLLAPLHHPLKLRLYPSHELLLSAPATNSWFYEDTTIHLGSQANHLILSEFLFYLVNHKALFL